MNFSFEWFEELLVGRIFVEFSRCYRVTAGMIRNLDDFFYVTGLRIWLTDN